MNPPCEGGCLCGALRYRLHEPPAGIENCHCLDCRRASGAPFVTWGSVKRSALEIVRGEIRRIAHAGRRRSFACCCGTPVFFERDDNSEWLDVTIASLDQPEKFPPTVSIWTEDALPWIRLDPALRTFPKGMGEQPAIPL